MVFKLSNWSSPSPGPRVSTQQPQCLAHFWRDACRTLVQPLKCPPTYEYEMNVQCYVRFLYYFSDVEEVDLLQAITIPFEDPKHVYFAEGDKRRRTMGAGDGGGFVAPSFGIRSGSNIMTPFGLLYADRRMFDRYEISARVKPADDQGGFLFAILDPMDRVLQLGVQIDPLKGRSGGQNVSLFYAPDDDDDQDEDGGPAITFSHPSPLSHDWNSLLIRVDAIEGTAAGFLNCVRMRPTAGNGTFPRGSRLSFDLGATLYVGQAGAKYRGAFEGVLQELKITRRPMGAAAGGVHSDRICAPADADEHEEPRKESESQKSVVADDPEPIAMDVTGLSGLTHEDVSSALLLVFKLKMPPPLLSPQIVRMRAHLKGDRGPMGPRVSE